MRSFRELALVRINNLMQDARFGLRTLTKNPGFACAVVLTLALGIGATTSVFSVVDALLLRPLPYRNSTRLVMVWGIHPQYKVNDVTVMFGEFKDWQQQNTVFDQMSAFTLNPITLTDLQAPEKVEGVRCAAELFSLLGVEPSLGRTFTREEENSGSAVAVMGESLWRRRYGADPSLVGRTVRLNGQSCEIVGILPATFQFPRRGEMQEHYIASGAELWLPTDQSPIGQAMRANANRFFVLAKLKPSVTVEQAQMEIATLSKRMAQDHPENVSKRGVNVVSLQEQTVGKVRGVLLMLMGSMTLILLIACANAANLLLVRGSARRHEIAVRLAVGSSRPRLAQLLLTESLLLALTAGVLGLLLAWGVIRLLLANNPGDLPRWDEVYLNPDVLIFTLGVAAGTGILFGLSPALRPPAPDLACALRSTGRTGEASRAGERTRQLLVLGELSLVYVLLVGMALMIQSFRKVLATKPGFQTENILAFDVPLPEVKYRESSRKAQFFGQLLQRLEGLPGVESVGATHIAPYRGEHAVGLRIEGEELGTLSIPPFTSFRMVSDNYLRTMGMRLSRGTQFSPSLSTVAAESESAPGEVIINESFAHTFFANSNPVNRRIRLGGSDRWWTVVGILEDFRNISLESKPRPEVYVNSMLLPAGVMSMTFVVRSRSEPMALVGTIRQELAEMDPDQPIQNLQTMEQIISHVDAPRRFSTLLVSLSGLVGLVLAVIGIYAVIDVSVRQRTREFGVRMALGAQRYDVLRLVLKQGVILIFAGMTLGGLGAIAITRLIKSQLYEITPSDPFILTIVAVSITGVTLLACLLPGLRATRVDPMSALRHE